MFNLVSQRIKSAYLNWMAKRTYKNSARALDKMHAAELAAERAAETANWAAIRAEKAATKLAATRQAQAEKKALKKEKAWSCTDVSELVGNFFSILVVTFMVLVICSFALLAIALAVGGLVYHIYPGTSLAMSFVCLLMAGFCWAMYDLMRSEGAI